MIVAASVLLSVVALVSVATGRNDNPPATDVRNAIVGQVLIDALYSLGLASVDDDDSKTRHLTVQTGWSFPIG